MRRGLTTHLNRRTVRATPDPGSIGRAARRFAALSAVALLLLPASLPAVAGGRDGLAVRGVAVDAGSGAVRVDMTWRRRELRRGGENAGSIVLLGLAGGEAVRVHAEDVPLGGKVRSTQVIALDPEELTQLTAAGIVLVAATHRHDDDGGLFDRAWYDATSAARSVEAQAACGGPIGPGADLAGCSLIGADLESMNLENANLSGADLRAANLNSAYALEADLAGAILTDANLVGVTLDSANLSQANLSGAVVSYADVEGANLVSAVLTDANLTDTNLTASNLQDADLSGANLSGAILSDVYLLGANLSGADLSGAITDGATFCHTTMPNGSVNDFDC